MRESQKIAQSGKRRILSTVMIVILISIMTVISMIVMIMILLSILPHSSACAWRPVRGLACYHEAAGGGQE